MKTKSSVISLAIAVVALLFAGCATQVPPGRSVFVYVAPNKAITYDGETFGNPERLPNELLKSGVTPQNPIIIVPQGDVEKDYLIDLVGQCGRGGLPNAAISEQFKATSFAQKRGVGINTEPSAPKPPKVKFFGNDVKKR